MNRSAIALFATAAVAVVIVGAAALAQSTTGSAPPSSSQDTGASPADNSAPAPPTDQPAPATPESQQPPESASPTQPVPEQQSATPLGAGTPEKGPSSSAQTNQAAGQAQGANSALPPPPIPMGPPTVPPNAVLVMTGLDKITGRPTRVVARLNQTVTFATLTITARYCYSTPASETPETIAFLQIDDHRADQAERRVFSGWMYASTPGLNGLQHPLYDVWVISCSANAPGQVRPTVASSGAAKVLSPDSTDTERMPSLPEGAGQ